MVEYFKKVELNLSDEDKTRNVRIFWKIVEASILPVLIGVFLGLGHWLTWIVGIIWWGAGIYGLFINWEDFIIQIILRLLKIRN